MTATAVVPPFLLHAGLVRLRVQVATPCVARFTGLRSRTEFTAESKLVNVSGPAVRAREQKRHRHLSHQHVNNHARSVVAHGTHLEQDGRSLAYSHARLVSNHAKSYQELLESLR